MKRTLLPLLFSSVLFANCTVHEEQQAMKIWKDSRTMQPSIEKYQKLQDAKRLCNLNQIKIDMNLFLIANELAEDRLQITSIRKLEQDLTDIRSENNVLYDATTQQENAQYIRELTDRLVEIQIKRNQGNKESLEAYQADEGDNKGFEEGKVILVPIKFANGKDRVQGIEILTL